MQSNDVLLTSQQQYWSELSTLSQLSRNEERELENRTRSGDEEAKAALIEGCLGYVSHLAWKYRFCLLHDDYLDLVGVGNLAVVERFDKALLVENPSAYIRGIARIAIQEHCRTYASLITGRRNEDLRHVESLDAPLAGNDLCLYDLIAAAEPEQRKEVKRTYRRKLHLAVKKLTEKQQYVIIRYLGWDGVAPESIAKIGERLSKHGSTVAYGHFTRAVKNLQQMLIEE
jgi:RNA polymerase sigma factor (sigma-70 family)